MECQDSHIVTELFQQASEQTVIFSCTGKIKFMNEKLIDALQQLNMSECFLSFAEKNSTEWNQFVNKVTQNMSVHDSFKIENDYKQEIIINLWGTYMQDKQLIFCRIQLNPVQPKVVDIFANTKQYQHLINGMPNGVVLASLNGKILAANPIALQLLDLQFDNIERKNYEILFKNCYYDTSKVIQYYRMIANNELATASAKKMNENGQVIYLDFTSKIDKNLGVLFTAITDKTEKMQLLETIEHQQVLSTVGQNVASIVHEIRNPMTSIQGFIQMIKSTTEEQTLPYFQIVESELLRLDELLVDLLTLSKPKKPEVKQLDLKELIEHTITLLQPKALESNAFIVFEYDENMSYLIEGNFNRLKQMLINLLKNAMEALELNKYIFVRLSKDNTATVKLVIEDCGKGMTEEQLNMAFSSFYSTKASGTGLGLSLVKTVIDEHFGKIFVESTQGVGTNFTIELNALSKGLKNTTVLQMNDMIPMRLTAL